MQQVAPWCNIPCVLMPDNYCVPSPDLSSCNNQTSSPPLLALCHHPSQGWGGLEGSEGADSHKRSSSSPLPLHLAVESFLLHANCCSLLSSQGFGPKPEINFSQGVWLINKHTRGTQHHPDLIMKRFPRAFDPQIDSSAFSPNWSQWGHAQRTSRGK